MASPESPFSKTCRLEIPATTTTRRRRPIAIQAQAEPAPAPTAGIANPRFQALLDSVYDAVLITSPDGRITDVNSRAQFLFEQPREALISMTFPALVSGGNATTMPTIVASLTSHPYVIVSAGCLGTEGYVFPAEIVVHRLDQSAAGDLCFFVRDISERIETEERLRKAERLRNLHLLAGGLAHEYRNLLTSVIGHLELAISVTPARTGVREDLSTALKDAQRMAELSSRMLAYSGRGLVNKTRVDFEEVIRLALLNLDHRIPGNVDIQFDSPPAPVVAGGDKELLITLAEHLITNAVEAVGQTSGNVRISVATRALTEEFVKQKSLRGDIQPGDYVALEIADTGYGMDEVIVGRIFDPFFSTKGAGRGLGLSEVQGIALVHGGAILVRSQVSEGSSFTFFLPVWRPESQSTAPAFRPATISGQESLVGRTVLVADDAPSVTRYSSRVLQSLGATVYVAEDGEQAVDQFRAHADEIDLVLLDMFMPKLNGDDALRRIRKLRPKTKVLIVSGYTEAVYSDRFQGEPPTGFLFKPFATLDFIKSIRDALAAP
jgi:PAS domain S-box-containing protein